MGKLQMRDVLVPGGFLILCALTTKLAMHNWRKALDGSTYDMFPHGNEPYMTVQELKDAGYSDKALQRAINRRREYDLQHRDEMGEVDLPAKQQEQ